ncbi:phage GP46 family protein [Methylobacillus pratensis]
MIDIDYILKVNGVESTALPQEQQLIRAVIISLFTWRRANADDKADGERMGWWGDVAEPPVVNDRIGSRLWLLSREKILPETFIRARQYGREALQWLLDDGVASKVEVTAERYGREGLALVCTIYRVEGTVIELAFDQAWEIIRAV